MAKYTVNKFNYGNNTYCIDGVPFVKGTQTAATGSWTGVLNDIGGSGASALYDGLTIAYWLPYAGSGNATLNLTINGTATGAKNCYYGGTTRLSTHFGAGNIIYLTYQSNANVNGSTYEGWWANANYNSNESIQICNNNKLIYDNVNQSSYMVYVPQFEVPSTYIDIDSVTLGGFWAGKYGSSLVYYTPGNSATIRLYSLPGQSIGGWYSYTTYINAAERKGTGWSIMSRKEWTAIEILCLSQGINPLGNDNRGKSASNRVCPWGQASRVESNQPAQIKTGTGPVSYSSTGDCSGIYDMVGNLNELMSDVRVQYGELLFFIDEEWKALKASDGTFITPDGSGTTSGSVKLNYGSNYWYYTTTISSYSESARWCAFKDITADTTLSTNAKAILKQYGLLPITAFKDANLYRGYVWGKNGTTAVTALEAGGDFKFGDSSRCAGIESFCFGEHNFSSSSYNNTTARLVYRVS